MLTDGDKPQWLSPRSLTPATTHACRRTRFTNRGSWTAFDEERGHIVRRIIHKDSVVHFSDRVTTLCIPGPPRGPRAASDWQLTAHSDPCMPQTEAKLLAQLRVVVALSPRNKGKRYFAWQEPDCIVSSGTNYGIGDPQSRTQAHSSQLWLLDVRLSKQASVMGTDEARVDRTGQSRSRVS